MQASTFDLSSRVQSSKEAVERSRTLGSSRAVGAIVHYMTDSVDNEKLSCRREAACRSVSLKVLLSHSRSLKVILQGVSKKVAPLKLLGIFSLRLSVFA